MMTFLNYALQLPTFAAIKEGADVDSYRKFFPV